MGEVGGLDWIGLDWPGYRGQRVKCQIQIKESEKQLEQQEQRDGWMAVDVKKKEKKLFLPLSMMRSFQIIGWQLFCFHHISERQVRSIVVVGGNAASWMESEHRPGCPLDPQRSIGQGRGDYR